MPVDSAVQVAVRIPELKPKHNMNNSLNQHRPIKLQGPKALILEMDLSWSFMQGALRFQSTIVSLRRSIQTLLVEDGTEESWFRRGLSDVHREASANRRTICKFHAKPDLVSTGQRLSQSNCWPRPGLPELALPAAALDGRCIEAWRNFWPGDLSCAKWAKGKNTHQRAQLR